MLFRIIALIASLLAFAKGEDPLPKVLVLSDPIYQQISGSLTKELKGEVDVVVPRLEPGRVFKPWRTILKVW